MKMDSDNLPNTEIELPLGVREIQKILPHRYPFLMIDQVTEFEDKVRIAGIKNVTANEPYFQGHFPGRPIMPGVMILEALAQLGCLFAKLTSGGVTQEELLVFSGVDSVRFRRQVVPGDVLTLELTGWKRRLVHWKIEAVARVGDEIAAEGILKSTVVK